MLSKAVLLGDLSRWSLNLKRLKPEVLVPFWVPVRQKPLQKTLQISGWLILPCKTRKHLKVLSQLASKKWGNKTQKGVREVLYIAASTSLQYISAPDWCFLLRNIVMGFSHNNILKE